MDFLFELLKAFLQAFIPLALLFGFGWLIVRALKPSPGRPMVCTHCEHHGPTVHRTRGSIGIEVVLWLCFLIPGLIYSLWRLSGRGLVCAVCESNALVPPTSPTGRRIIERARAEQSAPLVTPVVAAVVPTPLKATPKPVVAGVEWLRAKARSR